MLEKIASFHDTVTKLHDKIHAKRTQYFAQLFLLISVITASILVTNSHQYNEVISEQNDIIEQTLNNSGETLLKKLDGLPIQVDDGLIQTKRVHGTHHTYSFYFDSKNPMSPFIYNETLDKWITSSIDIPDTDNLPLLPNRVIKFLEEENEIDIESIKVLDVTRTEQEEMTQFLLKDQVYQLTYRFDDSAVLSKIENYSF